MTEVTNDLMYEVLKEIRADVSDLKKLRSETREGFASMRGYMASFLKDQSILETRLAELESEMDMVKRRLDLTDDQH